LPGETQAQVGGLTAQAEQSHSDILDGARRRGVGFGGIPIGEQVKYDSTVFKPAVANLYASQNSRKTSLEEALNGLYRDQRNTAMGVQQQEQTRDEQIRQFNEQMAWNREQLARQEQEAARARAEAAKAASSAGIGGYFGGGGSAAAPAAQAASASKMVAKQGGGFAFTDSGGKAISAAAYSKAKGIPFRTLLQQMANAGDRGAMIGLQLVGNDYGVNQQKLGQGFDTSFQSFGGNNAQVKNILNALMW
jgi:hypothetical protein